MIAIALGLALAGCGRKGASDGDPRTWSANLSIFNPAAAYLSGLGFNFSANCVQRVLVEGATLVQLSRVSCPAQGSLAPADAVIATFEAGDGGQLRLVVSATDRRLIREYSLGNTQGDVLSSVCSGLYAGLCDVRVSGGVWVGVDPL